nr:methionine aminotransferase [uncultured Flavobacterium sp.]
MNIRTKFPYIKQHIFSYMTGLAHQYDAINLSQGFPNFEPSPKLSALVTESLKQNTHQYAPMPGLLELREQIASLVDKSFGVIAHPDSEITIGCGATELIFDTIAAFVWPGDEVIIIEPGYDCYRPAIDAVGGKVVVYKMKAPDFKIDWVAFAQCISEKTRIICISSPNNPTGSLMSMDDLEQLYQLVKGTDIIIMSDEVYAHMVYDGAVHVTPLQHPGLRERTVVVYSFGKTLHITGWRVGYAIAPADLTIEIRKVHQNVTFSVPHALQKAIALYLKESDEYLGLGSFYQSKRDLFTECMKATKLKELPTFGSYFSLYDYSNVSDEGDLAFCERLVKEYGVAAVPVSRLYSDFQDDKLIRFCFAKTDDLLIEATNRLLKL